MIFRHELDLRDFKDHQYIDADIWLSANGLVNPDTVDQKVHDDCQICIRINYHYSEVEKYKTMDA